MSFPDYKDPLDIYNRDYGDYEGRHTDDGMRDDGMRDDGMRDDGMRDDGMRDDIMRDDIMRDDGMREGTDEIQEALDGQGITDGGGGNGYPSNRVDINGGTVDADPDPYYQGIAGSETNFALQVMNKAKEEILLLTSEKARMDVQYDEFSIPLHCVFYDPSGLNVSGGLLPFAKSSTGANVVSSAMGQLGIYFNDDESSWFNGAYFNINVEKPRFDVSSDLVLVSRFGGSYAADEIEITNGNTNDTCNITITDTDRNITENWRNISRVPKKFAGAINGTLPRPGNLQLEISLETADTSGSSFFVKAGILDSRNSANVPNGTVSKVPGKDSSWKEDDASMTFIFAEGTGILSLPSAKVEETASSSLLTVEIWVRGNTGISAVPGDPRYCCLVHHVSNSCAYTLMVRYYPISGLYECFAGKSDGSTENHASQRIIKSEEMISLASWTHLTMQHKQSYALKFSGSNFVDCGKKKPLDITKDLTIELFVSLDQLNIEHGLLGKGSFGDLSRSGSDLKAKSSVPYQVKITSDNKVQFLFEASDGTIFSCKSDETLSSGIHRIAIIKKSGQSRIEKEGSKNMAITMDGQQSIISMKTSEKVEFKDFYDISFIIDGRESEGTYRYNDEAPLGNNSPLEIGVVRPNVNNQVFAKATIAEVRLWERALPKNEVAMEIRGHESRLVSWWAFEENEGKVAFDFKGLGHGKISGAEWVKSPDPEAGIFVIYRNGMLMKTVHENLGSAFQWGDSGFYVASSSRSGQKERGFIGSLEEVRVWRTIRTEEQIVDNLFTRLKGEKENLLAYYTFDGPSCQSDSSFLYDNSLLNNNIPLPGTSRPTSEESTAPVTNDSPILRSAILETKNVLQETIDTIPSVNEYSDMQRDSSGNLGGVMKRCYSFLKGGQWFLFTGYKIGNIITEWIGQAQFDPQVFGYIEGAPPVPSENLVMGLVSSADDAGMITVTQSDEVTVAIGADSERTWDASFSAGAEVSLGSDDILITAPLGIGTAKEVTDIDVDIGIKGNMETSSGWSQQSSSGKTINKSREMTVTTGGGFEDDNPANQRNPAMGRRALPGNSGLALVQSSTADIFALRLAHNGALVSLQMLPNPDIPPDVNILPFPINPRYTKQGTLDGRIGYNANGAVVTDEDYEGCTAYGEYSYFKPREAYRLEESIRKEEQRRMEFYRQYETEMGMYGSSAASAAGTAALMMIPGVGQAMAALQISQQLETYKKPIDVSKQAGKRDMVNTYVWSAEGGFFAESTELTDSHTEVTANNFDFKGAVGMSLSANVDIFSFGVGFEFEAAMGGGIGLTKTKSKDATKSFSLDVDIAVPGILQKFEKNQVGRWVGAYDGDGNAVNVPGKVDAYRFKTFYLDSSSENYEDLFEKVVDPIWLSEDTSPNAIAMRQAKNSERKPPCWRVFHRVTFVSRLLPSVERTVPGSIENVLKAANVDSNWQLIQMLEPFVLNKRESFEMFSTAVGDAIELHFSGLGSQATAITSYLAGYYGVPTD